MVNLKILLEAKYWSWVLVLSVFGSIASYVAVTLIFNVIPLFPDSLLSSNYDTFFNYVVLYGQPALIIFSVTILIIVLALLPDCLIIVMSDIKEKLSNAKKVIPN